MMAQWFDVFDKLLSGKDVMDDENDKVSLGVVGVTLLNWIHEFLPRDSCRTGWLRPEMTEDISVIGPQYIIESLALYTTVPFKHLN